MVLFHSGTILVLTLPSSSSHPDIALLFCCGHGLDFELAASCQGEPLLPAGIDSLAQPPPQFLLLVKSSLCCAIQAPNKTQCEAPTVSSQVSSSEFSSKLRKRYLQLHLQQTSYCFQFIFFPLHLMFYLVIVFFSLHRLGIWGRVDSNSRSPASRERVLATTLVLVIFFVSLLSSLQQAVSSCGWEMTMDEEIAALHKNQAWDLASLPPGIHYQIQNRLPLVRFPAQKAKTGQQNVSNATK